MTEPNPIEKMLDNTILDWNKPTQLTSIQKDFNYNKLIPAIKAYFLDLIGEDKPLPNPDPGEQYLRAVGWNDRNRKLREKLK